MFCDSAGSTSRQKPKRCDRLSGRLRDRKTSDRSSSVCAEKSGCDNFRKNGKIQADCKKLKGQEINFPDRSVGATEQALLAAVLAEGEPYSEIVQENLRLHGFADFCKRWEHGSAMRKKGASGFRE